MKMKFKIRNHIGRIGDFQEYKSRKGLKTSKKRLLIIEYFLKEDKHFSVEELYNEIKGINPSIGYSTIYRTLKLLADCGMANIVRFGDGDIRFEPVHKAEHHDHLVCQSCGKIIEFENTHIEVLQRRVAQKHDFAVASHKLELYGLCHTCRKKYTRKKE